MSLEDWRLTIGPSGNCTIGRSGNWRSGSWIGSSDRVIGSGHRIGSSDRVIGSGHRIGSSDRVIGSGHRIGSSDRVVGLGRRIGSSDWVVGSGRRIGVVGLGRRIGSSDWVVGRSGNRRSGELGETCNTCGRPALRFRHRFCVRARLSVQTSLAAGLHSRAACDLKTSESARKPSRSRSLTSATDCHRS